MRQQLKVNSEARDLSAYAPTDPGRVRAIPPVEQHAGTSEIHVLFCFGSSERLLADDKAGNLNRWYLGAIPLADDRYTQHLITLKEELPEKPSRVNAAKRTSADSSLPTN
ncbi:hypothetical protein [Nonomuraea fuscirosea]|uniref:hypothetical protein n=1 Tax=Nonomuraea fuscirosea TaxID=1291556 RepID=UPI003447B993